MAYRSSSLREVPNPCGPSLRRKQESQQFKSSHKRKRKISASMALEVAMKRDSSSEVKKESSSEVDI
jgi:hypothetical protein